jgi:hypothetical protein
MVWLLLAALVFTLASRTFHPVSTGTPTVQSSFVSAKIQHRDLKTLYWWAPVALLLLLFLTAATPRPVHEQDPLLELHWDDCLANRPPPAL